MARHQLFEYAVLHHPKSKKDLAGNEEEVRSTLIVPVTTKLAKSEKEIAVLAAREIPAEYVDQLEQVEIIVRPFSA